MSPPVFTSGSIRRHLATMTLSGTTGLMALFLVDLVDLFFLGLLGDHAILAGLGFAGSILYFLMALNIGLAIGCGALVAQVVGAGDIPLARRQVSHILLAIWLLTWPVALAVASCAESLMAAVGADGAAAVQGAHYVRWVASSMPLLAVGMATGGILRALGDARGSMNISLVAAAVNALLDPLFIFGFDLGVRGAALATGGARLAMVAYGLYLIAGRERLLVRPQWRSLAADLREFAAVAAPAMLTNLASPVGMMIITYLMAGFGEAAMAGHAVVVRLQPMAFAGLYALSGAAGPIAGQNLGAGRFERIRAALTQGLWFVVAYTLSIAAVLALLAQFIVRAFDLTGTASALVYFFCYGYCLSYLFNGATYLTNAIFNNLKAAHYATQFNFAKATLGTAPFAYAGGQLAGPYGVYLGVGLGSALVAAAGVWVAYRHIERISQPLVSEGALIETT